ncbi:MAG: hypothetical protein Q9166_008064 [cf. Caloplaca sp. 2 TL-2023]
MASESESADPNTIKLGYTSTYTRRMKSFSPEDYTRAIHAHSLRSITDSLCPGQDYIDLATWLLQDEKSRAPPPAQTVTLATLHNVGTTEKPSCFGYHDLDALLLLPQPERNKGQVLFLQGFLPQNWVAAIGSKYDVEPDFFKRHLNFASKSDHRQAFSLPSLPSTRNNIFELNINTILYQNTGSSSGKSGTGLQRCRIKQEEQLSTYRRQLRTHARGGDSLVRAYSTLDGQYSVIEQRMSVCNIKYGNGWLRK